MSQSPPAGPTIRCMVCGKPSGRMICEACSNQIQGEAAHRKWQIERRGRSDNERAPATPPPPRREPSPGDEDGEV